MMTAAAAMTRVLPEYIRAAAGELGPHVLGIRAT